MVLASFEADGGIPEWLVRSELLAVAVDEVEVSAFAEATMSCITWMAVVPLSLSTGTQEVRIGTLRGILRDCRLTVDEFLSLLD